VPEVTALELNLQALGNSIEWPDAPNLSPAVRQRIRPNRPWTESRWAMAAAVAIVALAALLAYTPSRDVIADWLNLHTRLQRVNSVPTPSPLPPGPLGQRLGLGGRTTLAAAGAQISWKVSVPGNLGQPDEVYLQLPADGPPKGEVTLVYSSRPGIPISGQTGVSVLVTEARGTVNSQFFGKFIGPGTTIEDVSMRGHPGLWISGQPHTFYFIDSDGNFRDETLRLAGNTLMLDFDGTVIRIEGDLTKDQALQIAASLA
jgi:hypothetical protein